MESVARILTEAEAADLLRLPLARLKRLAAAGHVPSIAIPGGGVRFDERDLWQWIERQKRAAAEAVAS